MAGKKRVAVIFGGQSSEHEVSRVSAQSVLGNIDTNKYEVTMIGITRDGRWLNYDGPVDRIGTGEWQQLAEEKAKNDYKLLEGGKKQTEDDNIIWVTAGGLIEAVAPVTEDKGIDVVFPVLHGCNGEDGTIQGLLELAGIPYVGCGVLGAALGMDKAYSKVVFEKAGIPQGDYLVFNRKEIARNIETVVKKIEARLTYPCFIKPSNAGSSVGVSKAHDKDELIKALEFAAKYDRKVLVEEFIDGREIECAVLGNDDPIASTVGEVIPCKEFYDYEAKYSSGDDSKVEIPARLPVDVVQKIREYAIRAFKALDCCGLSRVDFFVEKNTGMIYINEINTLPGFTSISMYPKLWEASGISYRTLIDRLIELALERYEDNRKAIE